MAEDAEEFQETGEDAVAEEVQEDTPVSEEPQAVAEESASPQNAIKGMRPLSAAGRGRAQAKAENAGFSIPIEDGEIIDEEETRVDPAEAKASVFGQPKTRAPFIVETGEDDKFIVWVNTNLRCWIGPKHMEFKKDQKYRVSKNVKDVLLARGALKAV